VTAGRRWSRLPLAALAVASLAMKMPPPESYGRVVLDTFTRKAGVPPVAFDHWNHRNRYTCRVCHVDVGFAMSAGGTGVSASTNRSRFHCGACHDGQTQSGGKAIFPACDDRRRLDEGCRRCHAPPDPARLVRDYEAFAARFPRAVGGGSDWEVAEAQGRVRPFDFVEGASLKRAPLRMDKDVSLESQAPWMTDVRFSHKKHAVWNGCEVCHPEIYPTAGQGGGVRRSMLEINTGASCGVCHDKVAFPIAACGRCHRGPVE